MVSPLAGHEGGDVEPLEAVVAEGHRPLALRRPDPAPPLGASGTCVQRQPRRLPAAGRPPGARAGEALAEADAGSGNRSQHARCPRRASRRRSSGAGRRAWRIYPGDRSAGGLIWQPSRRRRSCAAPGGGGRHRGVNLIHNSSTRTRAADRRPSPAAPLYPSASLLSCPIVQVPPPMWAGGRGVGERRATARRGPARACAGGENASGAQRRPGDPSGRSSACISRRRLPSPRKPGGPALTAATARPHRRGRRNGAPA